MQALIFREFGSADVLKWETVANPSLKPGQVLVRTRAVGLNFADVYRRNGTYHLAGDAPWVLGYEGAGDIISDDGPFPKGTRVGFADMPFANAELVAVDADKLIPLPDDISYETAAAVLLQGLTAQYLVTDSSHPKAGQVALVHAAAGGVGLLLVQMLRAKGVRVIGVASSDEKRQAARDAGANEVFGYDDLVARVLAATDGEGVHVAYDSVGRTLGDSLAATRTGGTVVFYGMAAGDPDLVDPRLLMDRSLTLTGGDLWNVLTSASERRERAAALFAQIRSGELRPKIAATYALRDGAQAHRFLESRGAIGKVVMVVDDA
ncbi:quinone oxidoreductase family protein [Luteibacter aegosomatissinici]|uniref:quinone oxidoreductase family protein n=1 Tax=Luteibacter aegosomatissinici TaxID=2911539 RepID=UPI001FFBFC05|nr:quinone oxidoreductase [Luteibacter aegosomatissinici]UPG93006.1 quinone oxidoreductase [Luteibacter aegosomatissinici]